jgi:hypothetical protein
VHDKSLLFLSRQKHMTRPLKIIFIENHFDNASSIVNTILPQLKEYHFKNFFYERGESVTYAMVLKEAESVVEKISDDIQSMDDEEEREAAEFMLINFEATLELLKKLQENDILYRSVDTSVREESDLGYFTSQTNLTEEEIEAINLASSQAMAKAYLDAEDNTFGIMGYGHAEQVMEEILKNNQKDRFIFIFPYNQQLEISDEGEEFIKKTRDFKIPVICLDSQFGENDAQNLETISAILQEKLGHTLGHRLGM